MNLQPNLNTGNLEPSPKGGGDVGCCCAKAATSAFCGTVRAAEGLLGTVGLCQLLCRCKHQSLHLGPSCSTWSSASGGAQVSPPDSVPPSNLPSYTPEQLPIPLRPSQPHFLPSSGWHLTSYGLSASTGTGNDWCCTNADFA